MMRLAETGLVRETLAALGVAAIDNDVAVDGRSVVSLSVRFALDSTVERSTPTKRSTIVLEDVLSGLLAGRGFVNVDRTLTLSLASGLYERLRTRDA